MATFITIGYGDADGYDRVSDDCKQAAHARDDALRAAYLGEQTRAAN